MSPSYFSASIAAFAVLLISCQIIITNGNIEVCSSEFQKFYERDNQALTIASAALLLTCVTLNICKYSYSSNTLDYINTIDMTNIDAFTGPDHPVAGSFVGDLSQIEAAQQYEQIRYICDAFEGTITTLTSILDLEGTAMNDIDMNVFIFVKDLPVCMPPACEGQDAKEFSEIVGKRFLIAAATEQQIYTNAQLNQLAGMTSKSTCLFLGISTCRFEVCDDAADCESYERIVDGAYGDRFSAAGNDHRRQAYGYSSASSVLLAVSLFVHTVSMSL